VSPTVTVNVPRLSIAMTQGTVAEWLVADGTFVAEGDPLYVLEIEKTETEIESPAAGVLHHRAAVGDTVPVGTCVAEIVPPG
jgi:pyruvate/2-oxoglutarate dehydrogenase complex dihydrolipoamide acyltransferase (E2) component